jgi:hypothetical protein
MFLERSTLIIYIEEWLSVFMSGATTTRLLKVRVRKGGVSFCHIFAYALNGRPPTATTPMHFLLVLRSLPFVARIRLNESRDLAHLLQLLRNV